MTRRSEARTAPSAEVMAFVAICAVLLLGPSASLVEGFASIARERALSASEAGSLLVACVFGSLAAIAALVALTFASARRFRR
jgi:hypothetical protein